jgi:hypothetical protein
VESSPDGTQLAVVARQRRWRVGVYDMARSSFSWMSEDNVNADPVVWTREGDLLYTSQGTPSQDLYSQTPVAGASPQLLHKAAGRAFAIARHPNGNVLFLEQSAETHLDVLEIEAASGEVRPVVNTPDADRALALSPDGRWLALLFPAVGGDLFVQRYADGSRRMQVSTDGADWAEWSRAGDTLYYMSGDRLMSVAAERDAEQPFGVPTLVAEIDAYALWGLWGQVAVLGGDEFVYMRIAEERPATDRFVLATRWLDELDALIGDGR